MNRSDIIAALAAAGHPNPEAAVACVLDTITASLARGESVSIRNFGKFEPRARTAVTRYNPKTGVPIDVPTKVSVGFMPAPALKTWINRHLKVVVGFAPNGKHP